MKEVIGERTVQGRAVPMRRVHEGDTLSATHVLNVAETGGTAALVQSACGTGPLIVTGSENALALGSTITFHVIEGRVRFDIALATAERTGLRNSLRLLAVAQNVRTVP